MGRGKKKERERKQETAVTYSAFDAINDRGTWKNQMSAYIYMRDRPAEGLQYGQQEQTLKDSGKIQLPQKPN